MLTALDRGKGFAGTAFDVPGTTTPAAGVVDGKAGAVDCSMVSTAGNSSRYPTPEIALAELSAAASVAEACGAAIGSGTTVGIGPSFAVPLAVPGA